MLQCGPSLRTFVHLAAFLLAETSVCGQSQLSLRLHERQQSEFSCATEARLTASRTVRKIPFSSFFGTPPKASRSACGTATVVAKGSAPDAEMPCSFRRVTLIVLAN
jgi:hypothetical protein